MQKAVTQLHAKSGNAVIKSEDDYNVLMETL